MKNSIPIERIQPISKEAFYRNYVRKNRPVVITGLTKYWDANALWNMEYIANKYSDIEVDAIPFKNGVLDLHPKSGCTIKKVTVGYGIASMREDNKDESLAIATSLDSFPLEMKQQCMPPIYCAGDTLLRAKILIGPTGTVMPLHQDLFENIYTTVTGCKRITLFAPSAPVYRCSPFSKLPNFAKTNPEEPDYIRYPKFETAQAYTVDLTAGETLYIPAFWWHHLRNTEPTLAISFWWSQGWKRMLIRGVLVLKKLIE